ncbi:MAG: DUF4199 domain-containing protein [Bacteroidota bacterium]
MKREVSYGLYYGGFSILCLLVMYITELNRTDAANYLNLIPIIAYVSLIVKMVDDKKKENDGFISFSTVFKGGLIIGTLGGVINSVFYFFYIKFIDVTFIDYLKQKTIAELEAKGLSEKMIDQTITQANTFMTPNSFLITGIFGAIFVAAIISLIIAAIMKKPNPNEIA